MSFANILSAPATRVTPSQNKVHLAAKSSPLPATDSFPVKALKPKPDAEETISPIVVPVHAVPRPMLNGHETSTIKSASERVVKPRMSLTTKELDSISRAMDVVESRLLSDVEDPSFAVEKERYTQKNRKRALDIEEAENVKRKVRVPNLKLQIY